MSQDPLDYQFLLQDALRGLVRRSLEIVAEQGFTGDHHFYLSFSTGAPGVAMPAHLRDSYQNEMTIVLKTQFKDLTVNDESFSVGLYFGGVLYYLTVPFDALVAFSDPAVGFQLMFQASPEASEAEEAEEAMAAEDPARATVGGVADDGEPVADNVVAFSSHPRKKSS